MKLTTAAVAGAALCAMLSRPAVAQDPTPPAHAGYPTSVPPNAPHYVRSVDAPGLNLRYLDFKWDPEAFATLVSGGSHPAGRRPWVLARLLATLAPFRCEGKIVPVGPSLLILDPATADGGATMELRKVDMREIFRDLNVIAEPPPGETYCKMPAAFRKVDTSTARLEVTLNDSKQAIEVVSHYGDQEMRITLAR
jgi:hypothetical protein